MVSTDQNSKWKCRWLHLSSHSKRNMWYLIKVVIFLKRNGSIHDKDTVITIFNIAITKKLFLLEKISFFSYQYRCYDIVLKKRYSSWLQLFWYRILYFLKFVFSARNLFLYHSTFRQVKSPIIYLLQRSPVLDAICACIVCMQRSGIKM